MRLPDVQYARSGDVAIAYQVIGSGGTGTDIVFVRGMSSDLLSTWEQPLLVRHLERLAANGRLLLLDRRGTGLSDRVREVQSLETTMDDVRAVMDDAGSERAVLWTGLSSTGVGVLFAATYPERCAGLMLLDPEVRGTRSAENPWAPSEDEWRDRLRGIRSGWGERDYLAARVREWIPSKADDAAFVDWFVWHMRRSLSPGAALTAYRMAMDVDVTDVLAAVRVPTLVLARPPGRERARYVAERIRDARLVELPAFDDIFVWVLDDVHDAAQEAIGAFMRGLRTPAAPTRTLTTILFTDIVGSTETAARLGDAGWRDLLGRHHALVRRELARFQGVELDTAGDGFFATFDGPARAVQAAVAIGPALRDLGVEVRAGVHTGECELHDGKVVGIAVSIGARISSLAVAGEVLVSSTVKDLVAGSGIAFADRGTHALKGVPGEWHVFAVT
ncbi:MAG: alpha/beta fold hydrolase [Candidatus Limnocylindria bacterium]